MEKQNWITTQQICTLLEILYRQANETNNLNERLPDFVPYNGIILNDTKSLRIPIIPVLKSSLSHAPPLPSILVYSSNLNSNSSHKKDNLIFKRKPHNRATVESYRKINVGKEQRISCYYAKAESDRIERRCYRDLKNSNFIIVQYCINNDSVINDLKNDERWIDKDHQFWENDITPIVKLLEKSNNIYNNNMDNICIAQWHLKKDSNDDQSTLSTVSPVSIEDHRPIAPTNISEPSPSNRFSSNNSQGSMSETTPTNYKSYQIYSNIAVPINIPAVALQINNEYTILNNRDIYTEVPIQSHQISYQPYQPYQQDTSVYIPYSNPTEEPKSNPNALEAYELNPQPILEENLENLTFQNQKNYIHRKRKYLDGDTPSHLNLEENPDPKFITHKELWIERKRIHLDPNGHLGHLGHLGHHGNHECRWRHFAGRFPFMMGRGLCRGRFRKMNSILKPPVTTTNDLQDPTALDNSPYPEHWKHWKQWRRKHSEHIQEIQASNVEKDFREEVFGGLEEEGFNQE